MLKEEWLVNRGLEPPADLPGKVLALARPIKQAVKCRL